MIGDNVGMGAAHLPLEQAGESGMLFKDVLLFVVDVEQVELTGTAGKVARPKSEDAAQHGRAEGVEKEGEARAGRRNESGRIGADEAHRGLGAAGGAPKLQIAASDARQCGVQLHADDGAEGIFGGEQEGTAHAGAEVNESEFVDVRNGAAAAPSDQDRLEN